MEMPVCSCCGFANNNRFAPDLRCAKCKAYECYYCLKYYRTVEELARHLDYHTNIANEIDTRTPGERIGIQQDKLPKSKYDWEESSRVKPHKHKGGNK